MVQFYHSKVYALLHKIVRALNKLGGIFTRSDLRCGSVETCRKAARRLWRLRDRFGGGLAVRVENVWQLYP